RRWLGAPKRASTSAMVMPRAGMGVAAGRCTRSMSRVSAEAVPAVASRAAMVRARNRRIVVSPGTLQGVQPQRFLADRAPAQGRRPRDPRRRSRPRRRQERERPHRCGLPGVHGAAGCAGSRASALAGLETRVRLADHEDLATATDDLAVAVTGLRRLQGGQDLHDRPRKRGGANKPAIQAGPRVRDQVLAGAPLRRRSRMGDPQGARHDRFRHSRADHRRPVGLRPADAQPRAGRPAPSGPPGCRGRRAGRRRRGGPGIDLGAAGALVRCAFATAIAFRDDPAGEPRVLVNGPDATDELRTETAGAAASAIAAIPEVRSALKERQRAFRRPPGLVADGRDMGTVIFPDAATKVFLTASAEERAERRYKQLRDKGVSVTLDGLLREILARDARDANRAVAPLRPAEDAVRIDTTGQGIAAVVERVLALVPGRAA